MQNAPFFITKLGVKTLPCVILFRSGYLYYFFIAEFYFCEKHVVELALHLVTKKRKFGISNASTFSSKIPDFLVLLQMGQSDAHSHRLLKVP